MPIEETVRTILQAPNWTQRIAQIRLVPQRHGTGEHVAIYAAVARRLYMPHLAPDFAYIHDEPFYDPPHFLAAYEAAYRLTAGFTRLSEADIAEAIAEAPRTLLVFRTILGLTRDEFAHTTLLVAEPIGATPLSSSQVDRMDRSPMPVATAPTPSGRQRAKDVVLRRQAEIAAKTIVNVMDGELFGAAPQGLRLKQDKPDTQDRWTTVQHFAAEGVPLWVLLHQRHYGGAFRQVLDATSVSRGDLIEDAVQRLFEDNRIPFLRTGSHNQAEIAERFEVRVTPAPDFIVYDRTDDSLKAMIECKGTNNGGTARDKALRFERLRDEAIRLGGVALVAVLGGIGWARINDALGPVVRDTDGRVFTLSTLESMLTVQPFASLAGTAEPISRKDG